VRTRVVRHLREALTSGALGGLAFGAAVVSAESKGPPLVCDPLPPPIRCDTGTLEYLGQALHPWAGWQGEDSERVLLIRIGSTRSEVTLGEPKIEGGKILPGPSQGGGQYLYSVQPDKGARSLTMTVPVPCRGPAVRLRVRFDLESKESFIQGTLLDK
jgi:hypothetical protein